MSLAESLGLHGASARQAYALANPKTALQPLTPEQAQQPAAQQVVRLDPGAAIPEQQPAPAAPSAKALERGSYGTQIPISLGTRRLAGVIIQASALVPRLVGNKEYEVTYEIPAPEVVEPEEELNDGDEAPRQITIWCTDCNCYYCYVGPLDTTVPYDNNDKGTWPYMAMMGTWRSRLCTAWEYHRFQQFGETSKYGALLDKSFGMNDEWVYKPPPGSGLPNDPLVVLTCGPCAGEAPFPDSVESELERFVPTTTSPAPHTPFQYGGYFRYSSEGVQDENLDVVGFHYTILQAMARRKDDHPSNFEYGRIFRVWQDPTRSDQMIWPGSEDDLPMPEGWYTNEDQEIAFGEPWDVSEALTGMGDEIPGFWEPSGPHWRDYVKDNGGWAPEDAPNAAPLYKVLIFRREDPDNPFSPHKTFPGWADGMAVDSTTGEPLHHMTGAVCDYITDYSDI